MWYVYATAAGVELELTTPKALLRAAVFAGAFTPSDTTGMLKDLTTKPAAQCSAVSSVCPGAAGLELDVTRQKGLLRAAVFGRAFAPSVSTGMLRDLTTKLRVLNALRDPAVGLPLTMPQLEALTLPVVVHR